ncbi:MAG: carbohydrate kinase family protein [Erysipelotrichaceae bacterium]|nr:carbohydrate kinase family protein [Erysipelotrichaceae bacterium]
MDKHLLFIAGNDIDYFYDVEDFLGAGEAAIAKPADMKVGGCVLNTACVSAKLGSNAKVLDILSLQDESSKRMVKNLNGFGVDASEIQYSKSARNGQCLIFRKDSEKCIYVIEAQRPYYEETENIKELLNNSKYIYTLMHILKISFKTTEIIKEAKKHGAMLIFDGESRYQNDYERDYLLNLADGLFINKKAYKRLSEHCEEDPLKLMFNNDLKFAVISDGANGSDLYLKDKIIHRDAVKVNAIDSTGAGDSLAGCFLHFLDKGYEYEKCFELANFNGAYACTSEGGTAGAISEDQLFEFMKKTENKT